MLSTICAFGLIWHMWAVSAASFAVLILATIVHTFNYDRDMHLPAEDVVRTEHARTLLLAGRHE